MSRYVPRGLAWFMVGVGLFACAAESSRHDAEAVSDDPALSSVRPAACRTVRDCPVQRGSCATTLGTRSNSPLATACTGGACVYETLSTSCMDGTPCFLPCASNGVPGQPQSVGGACVAACAATYAVDPDTIACACRERCAERCGASRVCGGGREPSNACADCLGQAFAPNRWRATCASDFTFVTRCATEDTPSCVWFINCVSAC